MTWMKVDTAMMKAVKYYSLRCYIHFAGYMTYLSAVRIDAAHNNPVMNVFIYFLSQRIPYSFRSTGTYI